MILFLYHSNIVIRFVLLFKMESNLKIDEVRMQKLSSKIMSMNTHQKVETEQLIVQQHKKIRYQRKQKPLTTEQIEVFKQAFEIFDFDHSGNIDQAELSSLMQALGFNYTQAQMDAIFKGVDTDGSGLIEVGQFITFMSKQILDTENIKRQVLKVFKHFDEDNTGYLDAHKIRNMLTECFFNLQDTAITHMIEVADTDGDGKISQYQFLRIMKKVKLI